MGNLNIKFAGGSFRTILKIFHKIIKQTNQVNDKITFHLIFIKGHMKIKDKFNKAKID